ncbi:hypothetical protein JX265_011122 [Neoarthrinium moseri]|uniref:Uncharacterized protein n=1 Tax=Neoarthrinium moseri TaxID=1658444 RepID=A0A9P9WDC0_9PEZI|nr:hypothetical protein JX265_011122 [Neoarthrinium moseri]
MAIRNPTPAGNVNEVIGREMRLRTSMVSDEVAVSDCWPALFFVPVLLRASVDKASKRQPGQALQAFPSHVNLTGFRLQGDLQCFLPWHPSTAGQPAWSKAPRTQNQGLELIAALPAAINSNPATVTYK